MYKHINRDDRVVISSCLRQGDSYSEIAKRIGKDKGSISREIKKNKNADGQYKALSADRRAGKRRKESKLKYRRIENNSLLTKQIEDRLEPLISPETVAHELNLSHESIYAWIYRSRPDLKEKLPQRGKKRRRYGFKRGKKQGWTQNVRSIEERPEDEKEQWEGDTIRGRGLACLLTHVERESLFTRGDLLLQGTASLVLQAVQKQNFEGSITYDRGSEFALWRLIERDIGGNVYFALPHHPWQRGKNENTNGRLRRIFPKNFNFATISQRDLDGVINKMNHTPRKTLAWRTPCEVYGKCCTSD